LVAARLVVPDAHVAHEALNVQREEAGSDYENDEKNGVFGGHPEEV
jgi:hypothetical protein